MVEPPVAIVEETRHAAVIRRVRLAIERLGLPNYNWWNEALHGVGRAGVATVFPQAIGLAATWNPDLMSQIAAVIADELADQMEGGL